jgi:rRNA small subunit pseudouridine methyltransferase Nep1
MDSPLCKAGHVEVYIHTAKNVLIRVNPKIRIPRTYKRFAGLMVQLLHKLKIRSSASDEVLMKVVKNPITKHLPVGALRIGTSLKAELTSMPEYVTTLPPNEPVVYVVGAHAHGFYQANYLDREISVSRYALAASNVLGKICNAYEGHYDVQ